MNELKKKRIAAFLAATAMASFGAVSAADDGASVATENATYVDITINNVKEDSGLELGNNARARGNGSIATGTNSLAIGKNAVATGGNETKDTITNKLNENKQRLQEIQTAQDTADRLMKELDSIRKKEADVLEAGERVKQVRQAKEKARLVWQEKMGIYNKAVKDSEAQLNDARTKITDLNSRLTGVSKIPNINITSDEGLTNAATQLKAIAEEGTTLNLSVDFYKDYVKSYYKALGDLRQAENDAGSFKGNSSSTDSRSWRYWRGKEGAPSNANGYRSLAYSGSTSYSYLNVNNTSSSIGLIPSVNIGDDINGTSGKFLEYYKRDDGGAITFSLNQNVKITSLNPNTDIVDEKTYQDWQTNKANLKGAYINEILKLSDGKFKIADNHDFAAWTRETESLRMEYIDKKYDIAYYQGMYEKTKDSTWLDKKKTAMDAALAIQKQYDSRVYVDTSRNISVKTNGSLYWDYFVGMEDNFKQTEVSSIKERNKITTDTLTSELEKALGINKNAIQDIENNIAKLKTASDQAKSTYDNTNPSAADIALSQRYNEVMRDLLNKSNSLKAQQERLEALRQALTLHDLSDVGENAMAVGTNSLSTGTNSVAIGTNTIAASENAIAIGKGSAVTGTDSIAIGIGHIVIGNNAGTLGDPNTIYGDGSYAIGNNNTIGSSAMPHTAGTNTFVLGNNVTTTANNAVVLGAGSTGKDNTVSVGKAGAERQIINVAAGSITKTSTDAINGSQIHDILQNGTNVNVANWKTLLGVGSSQNLEYITFDNSIITRDYIPGNNHQAEKNSISIGKSAQAEDYHNIALGYRAHANDRASMALGSDSSALGYVSLAVGTQAEANARYSTAIGNNSEAKASQSLALGQDAKSMGFNSIAIGNASIAKDINEVSFGYDADPNLNSGPLNRKLTHLADGKIAENSKEGINGGQLFTELSKKANADASNIDTVKFAEKLGTGKVEKGNTSLVTGDTVYNTTINKANTDMDNLTDAGKTVIQNLAKSSVKVVAGTNTTVTVGKDGDATTYAVNVSSKDIKAAVQADLNSKADRNASNLTTEDKDAWKAALGDGKDAKGNTGLITGDTLHSSMETKANKDASNLSDTDKTAWSEALGTGTNKAGDKTLINGDTLHTELEKKADKTDITNITTNLSTKANKDASNISTDDAQKWAEKLGTGTITKGDASLVTGDTVYNTTINKANTDMDNLTDTGKTVIQNLAKDSVKVIAGTNTTVTTGKDGDATTYAVNVSNADIKAAVQSDLDAKADKDAGNLTFNDIKSWQDALSHGGKVEAGNTSLVTGGTVYNTVKEMSLVKTDGMTTYIDPAGTSTSVDVSHITKEGKIEGRVIKGVVTDVDNPTSVVNVGTMSNALENLNANVGSQINALDRKLTKDVKHAGATAAALAALNPLPYDASNKLNFAVGQGRYRGENATALGVFYQPNEDISISLGGTISSGDKAMNAGVSFRVGSGNAAKKTVKQSEFDALKAENKAMAERLDALQKQIEGLKAINLATADRKPFPDVPENHWAAEAVETLHANDVVEGYEDGEFKGDKTMTRYEYAQMLYKAAHKHS